MPNKEALDRLRRRIQLHEGETRTSKEEMEAMKAQNHKFIQQLRREILEKRMVALHPAANEYLMRQALRNHHTGGSAFREKEPRDVNESIDFELSDLTNKLNNLRHARRKKNGHLANLLTVFNDTVEDVVYLELEGPMGDSRCLALENHIGDIGKKHLEAETLQHTYKYIRDQLLNEHLTNETSIETVKTLLKKHEQDLAACQKSLDESRRRKDDALATSLKTEVDNRTKRKEREHQSSELKSRIDEQKHDFAQLWKVIQSFFSGQESLPLSQVTSNQLDPDEPEFSAVEEAIREFEKDASLLQEVTGSHSIKEVAERYEAQEDTYEHLQSMVKEMEVKKRDMLRRLEALKVERNAALYHDQLEEDALLQTAVEEHDRAASLTAESTWSTLAASNRVTQVLARLRQLLEYLAGAFAHADLMKAPPKRLARLETDQYLPAMLELVVSGAGHLMARLGAEEPDAALRRAAAARFALTRSEERVTRTPRPSLAVNAGLVTSTDEGETTGDDVAMPARVVMKHQAHLIVQAKIKAGFGKKKFV